MGRIDSKRYIPGTHQIWSSRQLERFRRELYHDRMCQSNWRRYGQIVQLLREERLEEATALVGDEHLDLDPSNCYISVSWYARSTCVLYWLDQYAPSLFQGDYAERLTYRWDAAVADAIGRSDREYVLTLTQLIEFLNEAVLVGSALLYMTINGHQGGTHYQRTVDTLLEHWGDLSLADTLGRVILQNIGYYLSGCPCHQLWITLVEQWPAKDLHRITAPNTHNQRTLDWIKANRPVSRAKSARSVLR